MHIFVVYSKSMQEVLIKEGGFSYIEKGFYTD